MFESLIARSGIYTGTFIYCFIGGLIPILNTELFLVSVATFLKPDSLFHLVGLATLGQMLAKTVIYWSGRGVIRLPLHRFARKMEQAHNRLEQWKHKPYWILLLSGVSGIPPFYAMSLASGVLRIRFRYFLLFGVIGFGIRFLVIFYVSLHSFHQMMQR